jgi:molybdopterin-guanine dinucleotide biosynthesis protein A
MAPRLPTDQALPAAVVLAGGRSTRMGGNDKSFALLGGRPLIAHTLERLRSQVRTTAISANGDPSRFAAFGLPVLADTVAGFPGPLAGLLAGMEWARQAGARQIVSVPTDSPFIPGDLVARLLEAVQPNSTRPVLAASAGRRHPVVGLWPVELAKPLGDFLTAGKTYKVSAFADKHDAIAVDFPMIRLADRSLDPFFNVNAPDDLSQAETLLEELR